MHHSIHFTCHLKKEQNSSYIVVTMQISTSCSILAWHSRTLICGITTGPSKVSFWTTTAEVIYLIMTSSFQRKDNNIDEKSNTRLARYFTSRVLLFCILCIFMFRWLLVRHGLGHGSQAGHGLQVRRGGRGEGDRHWSQVLGCSWGLWVLDDGSQVITKLYFNSKM